MAGRDVVVIGASAGGIEALQTVLRGLTPDYGGAIFVVLHIPPGGGRALAPILDRASPIPVRTAVDLEPIQAGHVYVCVADHHLLLGTVTCMCAAVRRRTGTGRRWTRSSGARRATSARASWASSSRGP
jgi:chemotaxis response regulator CheB